MNNFISTKTITESFEIGNEGDIITHFVIIGNKTYEVIEGEKIREVNRRSFKKLYGITWTDLSKKLKKEYFIEITKGTESIPDYDEHDYGFYYENDHEQLIIDGVWGEEFEIIK
jgi:hypothetical protein